MAEINPVHYGDGAVEIPRKLIGTHLIDGPTRRKEAARMAEWISVKERLPENLQSVLVLRKDGGIFIWMYSKESPTDDVWIDDYFNVFSIYDSTYWMPLPEPPEMFDTLKEKSKS